LGNCSVLPPDGSKVSFRSQCCGALHGLKLPRR
jgi:hypothetical protein